MIKKNNMHKLRTIILLGLTAAAFSMGACNTKITGATSEGNNISAEYSYSLTDNGDEQNESESDQAKTALVSMDVSDMFSERDMENNYEESECTKINLDKEKIEGSGAEVTDDGITITSEGEYILTGTYKNKQITVEAAEDAKVRLILKDAVIENENGAAIYVKSADKVFVTLAADSSNTISGVSQTISEEEETDAAVYSKSDLTVNGEGSLIVKCFDGKGIVSKDDLKIISGSINIESSDHALSGKDSVRIAGGNINVKAGCDGIHSGNDDDPEKGYVYIADGNVEIDALDDGIHAETGTLIAGGNINIINSEEGIEGEIVEIAGGEINVNSNDDGINATDGSGSSDFGVFASKDFNSSQLNNFNETLDKTFQFKELPPDGFKENKDENRMKPGFAENSENGGGVITPEFDDNFQRKGPGFIEGFEKESENDTSIDLTQSVYILISGGEVCVNAGGDGIDANGSVYITGGNVRISGPENGANGFFDYDLKAVITGGSLVAAGSDEMAMNFTGATQGAILFNLSKIYDPGEEIIVKDEESNVVLQYTPLCKFESIILSAKDIKEGETYIVTVGGETQSITMETLILNASADKGGK
ncbi:MAG: carbohydrate-binding domain-containing protein [Lachnospiraceae bacterium]|nr:carbohydrate-binding domain-containing protein [Lachnospiraceae bacterium]